MKNTLLRRLALVFAVATIPFGSVANDDNYRTLAPQNTLYMDTEQGRIVFELAQQFSPKHVEHIKALVRAGFYDGLSFYRVIDGFVVQGGDMEETSKLALAKQMQTAEFERTIDKSAQFTLVQAPDLLAEQTGFIDGFAVGRAPSENKEWLLTCPGVVNLARTSDPNSGTTDFAIMIGQAPRHLDRNMSIWGRIVYGKELLNSITRGEVSKGGVIEDKAKRSKIVKMTIASDLPKAKQWQIQIEKTNTKAFKDKVQSRRERANDFYLHKGNGNIDICYLNTDVKVNKNQ